ncbi:GABA permease GabA [Aspergillus flavus]|nr:GABA permease GabA [Aspergillus flavus]RAQ68962.1 GABA permease GabA [Aspergillus flavus]RAQ72636.1 GABA permease GabA [Aspergillus flavus]
MADTSAMKDIRGDDDAQLAAMGHKAELKRNFSLLSMLGLAFAILNQVRLQSSCPPIPRLVDNTIGLQ